MPQKIRLTRQPDGYQVIDVTTHFPIQHEENEILTWQAAQAIKADHPADYVQIIAVTEEQVSNYESTAAPEYTPQFFSFSPGTSRAPRTAPDGTPVYSSMCDPDRPDDADGELTLNPAVTALALQALSLARGRAHEWEQEAWSMKDFRAGFKHAIQRSQDARVAAALSALAKLVERAEDLHADLMLLDYNGFYTWNGQKEPHQQENI